MKFDIKIYIKKQKNKFYDFMWYIVAAATDLYLQ
jgi:hypothetical protein